MTLYKSILIHPSDKDLLLFPIWRVADPDCNLIVEVTLDKLRNTYACLDLWGFAHILSFKRTNRVTYFVVSTKGNPPEIQFSNYNKPMEAISLLPGPRLAVNPPRHKRGWKVWKEDYYDLEDIYRHPIRRNFVHIDPQMLFIAYEMSKAIRFSETWRWRIGDMINLLIEMGVYTKTALEFSSEVTGQSIPSLDTMYRIARQVPEDKRNYGRSWGSYRKELNMWRRSHGEIRERSTTRMGKRGPRRSKKDI